MRLLVPMCLLASPTWLSGCRPAPVPPAASAKPAADRPAASHDELAPVSEVTRQQGDVPVTSLTYDSRVFFDTGRDQPRPEAAPVLDALAERLKHPPGVHVAVLGHTDAVGGEAYNLALSRRRAAMVVRALEARGIDPATLNAVAVGKRQPIANDESEAGRARNRRVEFLISPSARAIDALLASRLTGSPPRVRQPAPLHLHVRQPDALSRAPLGDPVPY